MAVTPFIDSILSQKPVFVNKKDASEETSFLGAILFDGANVDGSQFCAVLGIGLGVKRHLLSLGQGLETFDLDSREVSTKL